MLNRDAAALRVTRASGEDMVDCLRVRRVVFIEGQSVPEDLEVDGLDGSAEHFIARRGERVVGTARMRSLGTDAKAERVAVLEEERGRGCGRALMDAIERSARAAGFERVILSAQETALEFYLRLGYEAHGDRFYEADIPHRKMTKKL